MRLGSALFLAYVLILAACLAWPIAHLAGTLRTRYLEGVEEPLVDQANILAAIVGRDMASGIFDASALNDLFDGVYAREIGARVYDLDKDSVDVRVYVTGRDGKILFDSGGNGTIGDDYSGWRDVRLTLEGKYGARTTLTDPDDPSTSILHVAAPIIVGGEIAGSLTVAKPTTSINRFLSSARPEVFRIGVAAISAAIVLSILVSLWVSGQIQRLTRYADQVRRGRRAALPRLARTELRAMGSAFDKMREALEGRKYVERYVQTLTHEIKSPVSAIRGAAELLDEEMPAIQRSRFLANIRHESDRIEDLVERMLKLTELETRTSLDRMESVPLAPLTRAVIDGKRPQAEVKRLAVSVDVDDALAVDGDAFLLAQAVSNLVQNAIDFSPAGGRVSVHGRADGTHAMILVEDEGPGMPDYARSRAFEKFFSLKRPDTGKKSTGLGLNFVKEVASLHGGDIGIENLPGEGLRASLSLRAAVAGPYARPTASEDSRWPGASASSPDLPGGIRRVTPHLASERKAPLHGGSAPAPTTPRSPCRR